MKIANKEVIHIRAGTRKAQEAWIENELVWFDILDYYPVGSLYFSLDNVNPGTLMGGTWVAFAPGRVLIGEGSDGEELFSMGALHGSEAGVAAHGGVIATTTGQSSIDDTGTALCANITLLSGNHNTPPVQEDRTISVSLGACREWPVLVEPTVGGNADAGGSGANVRTGLSGATSRIFNLSQHTHTIPGNIAHAHSTVAAHNHNVTGATANHTHTVSEHHHSIPNHTHSVSSFGVTNGNRKPSLTVRIWNRTA
jgi:hypothetical protein